MAEKWTRNQKLGVWSPVVAVALGIWALVKNFPSPGPEDVLADAANKSIFANYESRDSVWPYIEGMRLEDVKPVLDAAEILYNKCPTELTDPDRLNFLNLCIKMLGRPEVPDAQVLSNDVKLQRAENAADAITQAAKKAKGEVEKPGASNNQEPGYPKEFLLLKGKLADNSTSWAEGYKNEKTAPKADRVPTQ